MIDCAHLDDRGNDLSWFFRSIGNYKLTPTTLGLAMCTWSTSQSVWRRSKWLWRWRRFTRSTTPTSPRVWRGSLPSWRSWTTPSSSPWKRLCLSAAPTDAWSSTPSLGGNLGNDWKREDPALQAARGAGVCSIVIMISMTTMAMMRCQWTWSWRQRKFFSWRNMYKRGRTMFAQVCSSMRSRHPRPTLHKISPSGDQVSVQFSCNDGADQSQWWCHQWWCQRWCRR